MATGTVSALDFPNWQLLSTVTPTAGTATTDFTSLSGYNSYKLVLKNIGFSSGAYGSIYFNDNQTQYNYNSFGLYYNQSSNALFPFGGSNDADMRIYGPAGGNQFTGTIDITNANQAVIPIQVKTNISSANYPSTLDGTWIKATPETLTKITLSWTANYNGNGSITLFGLV